jgi:hypothetical protein
MADKKISALTASTTPLAGTEVLPIVQAGATVKVSISDVTAGRAVSASSLTASTGSFIVSTSGQGITTGSAIPLGLGTNNTLTAVTIDTSGNVGVGAAASAGYRVHAINSGGLNLIASTSSDASGVTTYMQANGSTSGVFGTLSNHPQTFVTNNIERVRIAAAGDVTVNTGNLVVGTAAKGIDFSANANAPGMTSELLNWYETGTWTPNQGGGLTVVGAFSSTGRYTRVGNQVTISGTLSGASSIAIASPGIIFTNIPYTVAGASCGSMNSSSLNASGAITAISGTTVYGNTCPAVSTIYFAMTYLV